MFPTSCVHSPSQLGLNNPVLYYILDSCYMLLQKTKMVKTSHEKFPESFLPLQWYIQTIALHPTPSILQYAISFHRDEHTL